MNYSRSQTEHRDNWSFNRIRAVFVAIVFIILGLLIFRGPGWLPLPETPTLLVYCFSGMQDAMEQAIFPGFQQKWLKEQGEKMEFVATFAGSGEVAHRILDRFPAEVAILASEMDSARVTTQDSGDLPQGVLVRTPIVIAVREGNPQQIADFSDLAKPGIEIVHADPLTSGAGQWSLLAIFGAARRGGAGVEGAFELLDRVWKNTISLPSSARDAASMFLSGTGDALITYEANLLEAPKRPAISAQIIYPPSTVVCEPRVAAFLANIKPEQEQLAEAFVRYLWTREAQEALVRFGFRAVDETVSERDDFGTVPEPFDLKDLGGVRRAKAEIVEPFLRRRP